MRLHAVYITSQGNILVCILLKQNTFVIKPKTIFGTGGSKNCFKIRLCRMLTQLFLKLKTRAKIIPEIMLPINYSSK